MYRRFLAFGLLASLAAHGADRELLTREDLLHRVVGSTIRINGGNEQIFQYLDPSGTIRIESTVHGKYAARWRFFDEQTLCFESTDPMSSGCVGINVDGSRITFVRRDGILEGPFELLAGNPRHL